MEQRDIKILRLLEAIQREPVQSQRKLSKNLNLSLGLVNAFVQNLHIQGIIKPIKAINNKTEYILREKGLDKKAYLTKQYVSHLISQYTEIKLRITEFLKIIQPYSDNTIVLYGAGAICEIACRIIEEKQMGHVAIVDENRAGEKLCGIRIENEASLNDPNYDAILIMDFDDSFITRNNLIDKGVPPEKIFTLLSYSNRCFKG